MAWDPHNECIRLTANSICDFANPDATHDYQFEFTLNEVGKMIESLGLSASEKNPEKVSNALSPRLKALMKLVFCICGEGR